MKLDLTYDKLQPSQLYAINTMTRQMASIADEENILEIILNELMKETGAEVGAFIYYDKTYNRFDRRTIKTSDNQDPSKIEFSQTIFRKVLESKEAVLSFDTLADENYSKKRSVILNKIHAILAFPLIIKNEVYGILYFDSRKNRQSFNESSRQFLSFFAPIASLTLEQALNKKYVESENILLKNQLEQDVKIPAIIGESSAMQRLFILIAKVAKSDASVIISGENGTGKDLAANAIHDLSNRKDKPYIAQYIGNIPSTILESELFGYKKGAFTGADSDKIGLFEAVEGGTLFFDEIGDLNPELQAKLLRVLQNKEIKRLGENIIRKVNVRILAATNKDLAAMVREGTFRQDLYFRLNVINIVVPPLRERKSDIPLLIDHFLKKADVPSELRLSKSALNKLMNYSWPGNVRQLENILNRALILITNLIIEEENIQFDDIDSEKLDEYFSGTMEDMKNLLISQRIKAFSGNKTKAADSLKISLRSLQAKAKELGI
jgi:Nif-specific regulatory protein